MAGKPKPDGRRVTLSLKLSEDQAHAVDQARGTTPASTWIRDTILAALKPVNPQPAPVNQKQHQPAKPCTTPNGKHPPINLIGPMCTHCNQPWR